MDETEARGEYKILWENGETDDYGFTMYKPGAVLLEVSVSDTSKIQYDIGYFNDLCISENRKTTLKIENIIECDGDIS